MMPSRAGWHTQQDYIRLSGPADGGWRQRPGGGPAGRNRRGPPAAPYLPPREGDWGREGGGRPPVPLIPPQRPGPPPGCPWIRPEKTYSRGVVGLHEEVEDFYQHMSPTVDEHHLRSTVFESIENVIHNIWCEAQVFIFGSFETGLYLPTSDIDVVVIGKWRGSPLEMLKDALISAGICDYDAVKVLDKAAVPIIKLTDRRSQIKVDISFNMSNGLESANQIKQLIAEYPHLPRLVMLVKQFLLQRELNEVFTGGVSSYGVILMVASFLQTHERPLSAFPGCNLGVLLIEFFELYGVKFNYQETCIRVRMGGYAPRCKVESQFTGQSAHSSPLCIEDPLNPENDIGRSSYHALKVKEAFRYAYHRLRFAVLAQGKDGDPNRRSILGRIVTVSDDVEDFRRWVAAAFPAPEPAGTEPGAWTEEIEVEEIGEVEEVEEEEVEEEVGEDCPEPGPHEPASWAEPEPEEPASLDEPRPEDPEYLDEPKDEEPASWDEPEAEEPASLVKQEDEETASRLDPEADCQADEDYDTHVTLESEDVPAVPTPSTSQPTPPPPPPSTAATPAKNRSQPVWFTEECRLAIRAKTKAKRAHDKRGTDATLAAFRKARWKARRTVLQAKLDAGVITEEEWEEWEEDED